MEMCVGLKKYRVLATGTANNNFISNKTKL